MMTTGPGIGYYDLPRLFVDVEGPVELAYCKIKRALSRKQDQALLKFCWDNLEIAEGMPLHGGGANEGLGILYDQEKKYWPDLA